MNENVNDLYELFVRLEWLLRKFQLKNLRTFGPMADVHRGQGRVLALLKLKPEMSQKELSTILDIRSQSLGELLAKLERSGYITRKPSEADHRVMMISLTETGMEAANQKERQTENKNLFGCLTEEEQDRLRDYLKRIILDLEQQFGEDDIEFRRRGHHDRPPFDDEMIRRLHERFGGHRNLGGNRSREEYREDLRNEFYKEFNKEWGNMNGKEYGDKGHTEGNTGKDDSTEY